MDGMPKPRLPYVVRELSRHGKAKWFFRIKKGPRIRLPDAYSTDPESDFIQAYHDALKSLPEIKNRPSRYGQNSLGWLMDMYRESAKFQSLAPSTRRARENLIRGIVDRSGTARLDQITPKTIRKAREKRAHTPEAANNFLKVMKAVFAWGVDTGLIDEDPTKDVKKILTKTDGHHTWTPEEIEQYEARHPIGTMARLALDLMLYTGLRRSDACMIGRQHIKGGEIHYRTGKTSQWVYLPLLEPLRLSVDATSTGDLTLLLTAQGKPFSSPASFGNWFRDRCVEARVPGRAHGLRKASAVIAAERGATTTELMSIFGWKSEDMPTLYTRRADQKKIALEAGKLLDRSGNTKTRT